ncbi:MAG: helix-turn-helix domain-containing protein [Bacilli bacterium]|nr:helix-turn-helix domain-containing protein [Bacilli bacterium]
MNQDKIGNFIKSIRLENNLTQKELADKLGVTYQAVSKWENGKNVPDIGIMKQISEEFNVNIDEILNGEKQIKENKTKWYIALIPILFVILGIVIVSIMNKPNDFEFKTISSKCSDFKITGSAAYNKDKTSIYISNIEFCGKEDTNSYKKIECTLYEKEKDTKTKISSCETKNNSTLEEFLKDTNIQVDNYAFACKNLTSTSLFLEIDATTKDNKTITYTIPIKLNDNCK